jgi:hypothetical protein
MIKSVHENFVAYLNEQGVRHRENGPAVVYNDGSVIYYRNGLIHRDDGPAMIVANGEKQYWMHVGRDSRGYNFYAICYTTQSGVNYRVRAAARNFTENRFTAQEALEHWKDNPECLELAKKAIAKFDVIKSLIDKE